MTRTAPFNDTLAVLASHRSIRQFKQDPIPEDHVRAAVALGQTASTSAAVQAYGLIRVTDPVTRARLAELTGPQEKVRLAPEFFAFFADARRHRLAAAREGLPYDAALEAFLVGVIDASLFAEKTAIAFEAMGYGICYIGGLRNNLPEVDALLGLPEGVYPLFGMCVGKPDQDPAPRPRLPLDAVLFENAYPPAEQLLAAVDRYDQDYRQYLAERGAEPKAWSNAMAGKFIRPERPDLAAYYRGKGARLD